MTREEAIAKIHHCLVSIKDCAGYDSFDEALKMAIRSLEAWDKAKKEIADLKTSHMIHFVDAINVPDVVIEIIDKHLSEVEDKE